MLQYVDHNHHDVIFFLEVGGGGEIVLCQHLKP